MRQTRRSSPTLRCIILSGPRSSIRVASSTATISSSIPMAGIRDILHFSPAAATTTTTTATPYHPNIALLSSTDHPHHHLTMTPVILSPSVPFSSTNIPMEPLHSSAAPSSSSSSKKLRSSTAVLQDGSFRESLPRHIRAPATFRCVKLTTVGSGGSEAEFAYQAVVRIGGHVFRGVLYHQGRTGGGGAGGDHAATADGNSNDSTESVQDLSELHLLGGGGNTISSRSNRR